MLISIHTEASVHFWYYKIKLKTIKENPL